MPIKEIKMKKKTEPHVWDAKAVCEIVNEVFSKPPRTKPIYIFGNFSPIEKNTKKSQSFLEKTKM